VTWLTLLMGSIDPLQSVAASMFKLIVLGVYVVGVILWGGVLALHLTRPLPAPVHPSPIQVDSRVSHGRAGVLHGRVAVSLAPRPVA
jgi:hypothetical protein